MALPLSDDVARPKAEADTPAARAGTYTGEKSIYRELKVVAASSADLRDRVRVALAEDIVFAE